MKNEKVKARGKASALVTALYVIAAVLMVIFIYMIIVNAMYIKSYADGYGIEVSDMLFDAIQYVVTGSISYFVYGLLVFCAAKIIGMLGKNSAGAAAVGTAEGTSCERDFAEGGADAEAGDAHGADAEETAYGAPAGEPEAADDSAKEDKAGKPERKWREVEIK